ncbi:MAG TPA: hypothetical protein VGU66_08085 [Candidatus Elarobacter sp.]|nr:hypothetical protein [Candidatus Elarobacter sp.]
MCHQTVRLVAEALEFDGIATAVVGTMRGMLKGLPRVIVTPYDRGQNFGPAGDTAEHAAVIAEALALFDASEPVFRDHKSSPA